MTPLPPERTLPTPASTSNYDDFSFKTNKGKPKLKEINELCAKICDERDARMGRVLIERDVKI